MANETFTNINNTVKKRNKQQQHNWIAQNKALLVMLEKPSYLL